MNVEMIEIVLLGTVGILQIIHYVNVGVIIAYAHKVDDDNGRQYDEWNSQTVEVSYMSAYIILTATLCIFAIAFLIAMKFLKKKIPPLIETLLLLGLAMFQWTIGILIAIYTSELTSPIGPHEDEAPDSDKYDTEWNTDVANTIMTFLFNIPITMALLLRAIKALSDGRGTLPSASQPSDRPPSITRESPQLRETLASHHVEDSRANNPPPVQPNLYSNPPPASQQQYSQPPPQQHAQQAPQQPAQQQYAQQPPQQPQAPVGGQQQPNPYPEPNPYSGAPPVQEEPHNTTAVPMARDTFRSSVGDSPTNRGDQL